MLLPAIALSLMLAVIFSQQPRAMSYVGLTLLLNLAVPVILATLAQLCVIAINDLDLSHRSFVGLCACIAATLLKDTPLLGVAALGQPPSPSMGWSERLIHWRALPSIVVTLGLSFIWMGLAVLILPTPGGRAPEFLTTVMKWKPDFIPLPILYAVILGLGMHLLMRSSVGTILRGAGGNPKALANAGWSLLRARVTLYLLAGTLGRAVGAGAGRIDHVGRRQHGAPLHAAVDRRGDPGRRRVHRRQGQPDRRRAGSHDADAGRLLPDLHAYPAGLADRSAGRDPDHRAGAARRAQPGGGTMITNDLPTPADVSSPRRALVLPVWVWPLLAAAVVLAMTLIYSGGRGAADIMSAAVTFSALFVIVGLGQMLVITSGPGNVDLSIPAAISLAGAIAMKVMDGSNGMILAGLAAALGAAMALGVANYLLIRLLRIPPIIATLSSALIVQSIAIAYGRGLKIKPPPAFADFCTGRTLGISNLALVAAVLTAVVLLVLARTVYGRTLLALGQNQRAARLAGTPVSRARLTTSVVSAGLAGLCGVLLAGFSGGSSLNMGEEYLLASIAVTVIGGTSVAGGRAEPLGIWGAALLLFLIVTMLNTFGLSAGVRLIATGVIIVTVIAIGGGRKTP